MEYFWLVVLALVVSMLVAGSSRIKGRERTRKPDADFKAEASYWMGRYYALRLEENQMRRRRQSPFEGLVLMQKKGGV